MIEESQRQQEHEVIRERASIFRESENASQNIDMSKDQVDTIRSAMANFQLPQSAVPSWATNLSDEEWQKVLSDKLSLSVKK